MSQPLDSFHERFDWRVIRPGPAEEALGAVRAAADVLSSPVDDREDDVSTIGQEHAVRTRGPSYKQILDTDSREVPAVLRAIGRHDMERG